MAFGAETYTDSGTVQLSANLRNPVLRASGNATTVTNNISSIGASKLEISYARPSSSNVPLVAVRPSSGLVAYYAIQDITSLTWTWIFLTNLPVGTSIPYWVFDAPPTPSSSGMGLQLFDSSGALCYSIQDKPLRIRDVITGVPGAGVLTTAHTYESGRTYAPILCRWTKVGTYRTLPDETDNRALAAGGTTNGINVGGILYETVSGNDSSTNTTQRQVLVADVTNY